MLLATALAAFLQGAPAAPPQDTVSHASAYADEGTRALVAAARERRSRVERGIDLYRVTARQRVHAGLRAVTRNRTLAGGEIAARIEWRRGQTGSVQVLGAREASPAADRRVRVPEDLAEEAPGLAFDPDMLQLDLFSLGARDSDDGEGNEEDDEDERVTPVDPLSPGSEAHYRFRSGDTVALRLPDGSRLELVELEVIPRRSEFRLLRGTLMIDRATHGVVRSVVTTARPFDLARDTGEELPGVLKAGGPVRAEVRYVTVEYALVQGRFWLPRLVAFDAEARLGFMGRMPIRYERSYSDYEVVASERPERAPVTTLTRGDSATRKVCEADARRMSISCVCEGDRCGTWRVTVPDDTAALLTSPDLPPPLEEEAGRLITGEEVESLARELAPSLADVAPDLETGIADLRTLRYNRVEALSVGARAQVSRGVWVADAQARIGVADLEPNVEVGVARETMFRRTRLAGYRRLTPFDPSSRALGLGNSLSALLLGSDEADYFLATGAEVTGAPARAGRFSYSWRVFGEHQHPVAKNTDVSLAAAWEGGDVFRGVRPADRADQVGASLTVGRDFGSDRGGARLTTGATVEGQAGTFGFGRGQALARVAAPAGRLALALEGAAGTSAGAVPLQGEWYRGGPASVRGYEGALFGGTAFWRARAEVATPLPAARLVAFGDAGWVGDRGAWELDPPLLSAGVGASFLDGLVRLDLARALRSPTGWRLHLYLDGAL